MEKRIRKSETRQFKVVIPANLNDHKTLFGGMAMQWMDEVAYITAIRFVKKKMVTVSAEKVHFLQAVKSGDIVEVVGNIVTVGKVKIEVQVEMFVEDQYLDIRHKAVEALFTLAAIDNADKPIPIGL